MRLFRSFLKSHRCNAGVAALEFALILPIMVSMFIATAEITRYAVIHQKLRTATHAMADFTTRNTAVTKATLTSYANAVDKIMQPFNFTGTVIFSSVASNVTNKTAKLKYLIRGSRAKPLPSTSISKTLNTDIRQEIGCINGCLIWQEKRLGPNPSKVATAVGKKANLHGGYKLAGTQDIIVTEIFYQYAPMLAITGKLIPPLAAKTEYSQFIAKPRQEKLINPPR